VEGRGARELDDLWNLRSLVMVGSQIVMFFREPVPQVIIKFPETTTPLAVLQPHAAARPFVWWHRRNSSLANQNQPLRYKQCLLASSLSWRITVT